MKRKVIQIAQSTQLVSLPRKWALRHEIKKGDELEITEKGNKLEISLSSVGLQEKKLELNISDASKFLRRLLFSPYIQGYTQIDIRYNDKKVFDLISQELELLMGYEIITQESSSCTIKSVATTLDNDFDTILNRIFVSTISMMKEMIAFAENNETSKLINLTPLEVTNNRLTYFCLRVLNKKGYQKAPEITSSIYYIILCIEEIFDDLRDLCEHIADHKLTLDKTAISLLKKVLHNFEYVYKLFNDFNSELLYDFNNGIREIRKQISTMMSKGNQDPLFIARLLQITDKIGHISKEIHY